MMLNPSANPSANPTASTSRSLCVGIGSPFGDDRAGWCVAERLAKCVGDRVGVRLATSPIQMLDWMDGVQQLVLCDACVGLGRVGDIQRWSWQSSELLQVAWSGTHDVSLVTALQLASQLGRLPNQVVIWSIEADAAQAVPRLPNSAMGPYNATQPNKTTLPHQAAAPHQAGDPRHAVISNESASEDLLSPLVARAVPIAVEQILQELAAASGGEVRHA